MKEEQKRACLEGSEIFPRHLSYNAYMRDKLNAENCPSSEKILGIMSRLLTEKGYPKKKLASSLLNCCLVLNTLPELYSRNHTPYNAPLKNC